MDKIATKATWENEPIDKPQRIDILMKFTEEQFSKLKLGLIPRAMEDKWFIFYENDWLYFHRSWTGFGIFKAKLIKGQDGHSITEFWAERNQDKYSIEDDQSDIETLLFLITEGLLGIDTRGIYFQNNIKSDVDMVKGWSNFGTLLFKNKDAENTDLSDLTDCIKSVLLGVAVGDAIGVPVEFKSRATLREDPVTDMFGFGTHNMPSGTIWLNDWAIKFRLPIR